MQMLGNFMPAFRNIRKKYQADVSLNVNKILFKRLCIYLSMVSFRVADPWELRGSDLDPVFS